MDRFSSSYLVRRIQYLPAWLNSIIMILIIAVVAGKITSVEPGARLEGDESVTEVNMAN